MPRARYLELTSLGNDDATSLDRAAAAAGLTAQRWRAEPTTTGATPDGARVPSTWRAAVAVFWIAGCVTALVLQPLAAVLLTPHVWVQLSKATSFRALSMLWPVSLLAGIVLLVQKGFRRR